MEPCAVAGNRSVSDDGPEESTVSEGEGTTFMQWRERAQSEVRDDRPKMRAVMIVAAAVVVIGIVVGALFLLLS
ncbi:hypothetical protein SAMN02982929_03042 [Saccharopolyspora kobensis]|uniref:Uncharacterized protein n=1 Tax=Saccharopolyspora kobensis TaxID=146035 RepID=A0A1H6C1X5_9PSEU|nr:hypothetical protein SAMN02982929_03042 [Saccharopolyspora kobensis]SFC24574.1 hypothetical protein SAMN05216506_101282 [Saccharopolyspora kobensis]